MGFGLAAILRSPVGQHAQHAHVVFRKERQHPVIQQIGSGDRRLGGVELGHGHLAVGVDKGLLVDSPDPLDGADVEGVLRTQIAGVRGFDLTVGQVIVLLLLQRRHLSIGEHDALLGDLFLQGAQALLERRQVVA